MTVNYGKHFVCLLYSKSLHFNVFIVALKAIVVK